MKNIIAEILENDLILKDPYQFLRRLDNEQIQKLVEEVKKKFKEERKAFLFKLIDTMSDQELRSENVRTFLKNFFPEIKEISEEM